MSDLTMGGFLLSDAELHGLIDGQIEVHHRADILRRAATSAVDRERIGTWQSQCELIRSAFRGIDREPLPSALDMRAPTRLHAVAPSQPTTRRDDAPPLVAAPLRRQRLMLPSLAALIASAGLAATWLAGGFSLRDPVAIPTDGSSSGQATTASAIAAPSIMPTSTIPDLASLGFSLTAAEMRAGDPASMLFHYRNAGAEQITLGVSRSDEPPAVAATRPTSVGQSMVWHAGVLSYALDGNLQPGRLHALAASVRDLAIDE